MLHAPLHIHCTTPSSVCECAPPVQGLCITREGRPPVGGAAAKRRANFCLYERVSLSLALSSENEFVMSEERAPPGGQVRHSPLLASAGAIGYRISRTIICCKLHAHFIFFRGDGAHWQVHTTLHLECAKERGSCARAS